MKKMTFAVWFTALLAVFTFSSCLDSDNGGQRQGSEIVKVTGLMGTYEFESAAGYKLVPSNMSSINMDISTRYAYIAYTYDSEAVTENVKKISVVLNGVMPIHEQYTHPSLEGVEGFSNAPIRNITTGGSYEFFPVSFWDANTMFLPITYFIKDLGDRTELQKEIDSHSFEIYYDLEDEDVDANSETLVLHVAHHVADPSLNKDRSHRYNTSIYEVNLQMAISDFEHKNGNKPRSIVLKYKESYNGEFTESQMTAGKAEINYEAILNASKH